MSTRIPPSSTQDQVHHVLCRYYYTHQWRHGHIEPPESLTDHGHSWRVHQLSHNTITKREQLRFYFPGFSEHSSPKSPSNPFGLNKLACSLLSSHLFAKTRRFGLASTNVYNAIRTLRVSAGSDRPDLFPVAIGRSALQRFSDLAHPFPDCVKEWGGASH